MKTAPVDKFLGGGAGGNFIFEGTAHSSMPCVVEIILFLKLHSSSRIA